MYAIDETDREIQMRIVLTQNIGARVNQRLRGFKNQRGHQPVARSHRRWLWRHVSGEPDHGPCVLEILTIEPVNCACTVLELRNNGRRNY